MDTKNNKVEDDEWDRIFDPDPEEEARQAAFRAKYLPRFYALLDKVRAGEMTEDECADAVIHLRRDLGFVSSAPHEEERGLILNHMMHSLHQDELDRIQRETGRIID